MYILNRKLKAMLKQGGGEGMTSFREKNWHIYRERESSRLFNLMFNMEFKKKSSSIETSRFFRLWTES